MYATLENPSKLANKINFEQKQDVPASLYLEWVLPLDTEQKSYELFLKCNEG